MTVMEIMLLILGVIIFVASFVVPETTEDYDETLKLLTKEQMQEMMQEEVKSARQQVSDAVEETVSYSVEKSERALERLTNDKIQAISEYSETVLSDIHKNHEETVFLYDMLNTKHENLKEAASEVDQAVRQANETVNEVGQAVRQANETVSEVQQTQKEAIEATQALDEAIQNAIDPQFMPMDYSEIQTEPTGRVIEPVTGYAEMPSGDAQQALLDEAYHDLAVSMEQQMALEVEQQLKENAGQAADGQNIVTRTIEEQMQLISTQMQMIEELVQSTQPQQSSDGPEMPELLKAIAPDESMISEMAGQDITQQDATQEAPTSSIELAAQSMTGQAQPTVEQVQAAAAQLQEEAQQALAVVEQFKEEATAASQTKKTSARKPRTGAKTGAKSAAKKRTAATAARNADVDISFDMGQEAMNANSNDRILMLHKKGKSNIAIAKELGLGVGEVKLVIDLYDSVNQL